MKTKIGTMTLEYLMKVHRLELGDKTYEFPNKPELPAGQYDLFINERQEVLFVKTGEYMDPDDAAMMKNLLERSEHQ